MMESVNFVVLGDQSITSDFGKKGTSTDLTLYDRKESEKIYTWVTPNGFPEKIQPLFQAIALAEYVIFHVSTLDKFTGEQILALDALGKKEGILSHSYDVDESRLDLMIKGTVIEGYKKVEQDKIKEELANFSTAKKDGSTSIVIDHSFDVKGVGTVALGKVISGKITQYDKILHHPSEIEVMVKSIQMHDDDVKESIFPGRVGLSLKNIKHDEITRGDILSNDTAIKTVTEITIDFKQNQFFKETLSENQMCLVNIGLQIKAAKFASISPLKLIFEKPVIIIPGDVCVLLKPESNSVRIIGSGIPQ
jgi:selenocysteine-specific translation elongation factor|tara:strand:+ start:2076 stop:2996 length:921 start_codon:yes stop_codon:yes gene_type:complete